MRSIDNLIILFVVLLYLLSRFLVGRLDTADVAVSAIIILSFGLKSLSINSIFFSVSFSFLQFFFKTNNLFSGVFLLHTPFSSLFLHSQEDFSFL